MLHLAALALGFSMVSAVANGGAGQAAEAIVWEREVAVAQARAAREQKPLLMVLRCER